jgi:16S rRNA (guanine527-N7)-methyltransferase
LVPERVSRETLQLATALEQLRAQAKDWGIELNQAQVILLAAYSDLLAGYDLANVIGTRDRTQILLEHLLGSLSCLVVENVRWDGSAIDIGTGGGLPGIPLSIVCSKLRVTLLEATEKKVRFLEYTRAVLSLENLEVLHTRAEDAGRRPDYREAFDIATARALATLPVLLEYCAPLVRPGGTILAMKGRLPEQELSQGIAASHELGLQLRDVLKIAYDAQLPQKERRLVVFEKVYTTPSRFPRRVGLAKKRPLGV